MVIVKSSIRILDLNELNITPPISAIGSDAYFIVSENFFLKITLPPLTSESVTGYVANYGVEAIYINHRQITNTYNYGWRVYMPDGMTATLRSWK
mgnify:CR=1 FL=1